MRPEPQMEQRGEIRWEYQLEQFTIAEKFFSKSQQREVLQFTGRLNQLGSEGWEMLGFESVQMKGAIFGGDKGLMYLAFFKRRVPA